MKYTTIKIPNIVFYFVVGLCGFLGFASFFGSITKNNTIGWIAGIIGFIIIILTSRDLDKRLEKKFFLKEYIREKHDIK